MTQLNDFNHHILSVLVQNRPGVLARVAGLFARRGFNIFSLAVAPAEEDGFSRITIVVDVESTPLEQITKQLFKLVEVIKISELDPRRSVERELLLLTVRAQPETRGQIVELVNVFEAKGDKFAADAAAAELATKYAPGTAWYAANESDREAMDNQRRIAERALYAATRNTHSAATTHGRPLTAVAASSRFDAPASSVAF